MFGIMLMVGQQSRFDAVSQVLGTSTSSQMTTSAREPVTLAPIPLASMVGSRSSVGRLTVN